MRIFVCNHADRARNVSLEFRGRTTAAASKPAGMLEIVLGEPRLVERHADRTRPRAGAGPDGAAAKLPARA